MNDTLPYSRLSDAERPFHVERRADGSVAVSARYTEKQRRDMVLATGGSLLAMLLLMAGAWAIAEGWHGAAAALVLVLLPAFILGRFVYTTFSTHRFVASAQGLLIETTSPRAR